MPAYKLLASERSEQAKFVRPVILRNFGGRLKKGVAEECPQLMIILGIIIIITCLIIILGIIFMLTELVAHYNLSVKKKMSFGWGGLLGNDAQRNVEI